jgi:hypothetical protein
MPQDSAFATDLETLIVFDDRNRADLSAIAMAEV